MLDGTIFGFVDNAVLVLGAFSGLSIESKLPQRFQTGLGAIYGAAIGNTVSDALGAIIDPTLQSMVIGITLGCLLGLCTIPVFSAFKKTNV